MIPSSIALLPALVASTLAFSQVQDFKGSTFEERQFQGKDCEYTFYVQRSGNGFLPPNVFYLPSRLSLLRAGPDGDPTKSRPVRGDHAQSHFVAHLKTDAPFRPINGYGGPCNLESFARESRGSTSLPKIVLRGTVSNVRMTLHSLFGVEVKNPTGLAASPGTTILDVSSVISADIPLSAEDSQKVYEKSHIGPTALSVVFLVSYGSPSGSLFLSYKRVQDVLRLGRFAQRQSVDEFRAEIQKAYARAVSSDTDPVAPGVYNALMSLADSAVRQVLPGSVFGRSEVIDGVAARARLVSTIQDGSNVILNANGPVVPEETPPIRVETTL